MAITHAYYHEHVLIDSFNLCLPRQWHQKCLLAFLNAITKYGVFKFIPGNSSRNACWRFLALPLGFVFPSNGTRKAMTVFLNAYRNILQAHRYIVVAFHPEVFGYRSFIFSQRKAWCKSL